MAHLVKNKVLFLHDNALAHTSAVATAKLVELHYEQLSYRPYSPDLAPCDIFFFKLSEQKFESSEEVNAATEAYFTDLEKTYFSDGLKKLEHRYVEK